MFVKSAVINFLVSTTHYSNMAAKIYRHEPPPNRHQPPPNHTTSSPGSSRFPIWRRGVQEHSRITWSICAVLDRRKWKSKPPSLRNQGWSRAKAKTRHFLTLDLWGGEGAGGGGVQIFHLFFPRLKLSGALWGQLWGEAGKVKEGELATTSLEFEFPLQ